MTLKRGITVAMSTDDTEGPSGILVEAEDFADYGGWLLDSQFETEMGSPYLLAHGMGRPVADAKTVVRVPEGGRFRVWVRAKDWVPSHHPGRFSLSINGEILDTEFGANGEDWAWQSAGEVWIPEGEASLVLHDLTGFDGRCDAIFLGADQTAPPNTVDDTGRRWRNALRGLPDEPVDEGHFDVIVVGGGIAGCAAALTAARLGQRVALIHDRPVLGGNASNEIGLKPRGVQSALLGEIAARSDDGDIAARALLEAEPSASVFFEHRVVAAATSGNQIVSVDAVQARGGMVRRFRGRVFIDASGKAVLGVLTGAETMFGRESRSEYNESYAPEVADPQHHGNTLFFRTGMADSPISFPDVPWASEVAKDYANLSGQLVRPGQDNGVGPSVSENPSTPAFRFSDALQADPNQPEFKAAPPEATFPATHFWEYGQWLDPYTHGEEIRDYLLRALYGTFANVKKLEPELYANLQFEWLAHVAAQGEFRRYRGDYVLTQNDIVDQARYPDTVVPGSGAFCLHVAWKPGESEYDFRLKDWILDTHERKAYGVPFRCLYSRNIDNLMMAGKHISVTHVAGSATKFMGDGAMHGLATAAAARLCNAHGVTPRQLYKRHLNELIDLVDSLTEHPEQLPTS